MTDKKQQEFLQLYEPIHDRFERFCRARVYGNMEYRDLMNDTLLVAFEKFDTLRSNKAFLSFLFSISVRILSNNNRKKKEDYVIKEEQFVTIKDENANTQMDAEIHFLYQALAKLNDNQRESIILFEITGLSIKEIALVQNASQSAVKLRLRRGRKKLTEILTYDSSTITKEAI